MAETLPLERPAKIPAPVAEHTPRASGIMALIERAALSPEMDVDKLERLLGMAERTRAIEAKQAYFSALSDMQDELPSIQERGEIKIGQGPGQKYALWEDINKAIKPIMKAHGFALSFRVGMADTKITVTGVLSHRDGHSEETTIHLPSDTSGSKNAVQAVGSSTSYGKRYTASALLNLTSGGDDDDGQSSAGGFISADQAQHLRDMLARGNFNVETFCAYFKIDAVPSLPAKEFERACQSINDRIKGLKK